MYRIVVHYSWLVNAAISLFVGGVVYGGVKQSQEITNLNQKDISILQQDVATIKGEVHGLYMIVKEGHE